MGSDLFLNIQTIPSVNFKGLINGEEVWKLEKETAKSKCPFEHLVIKQWTKLPGFPTLSEKWIQNNLCEMYLFATNNILCAQYIDTSVRKWRTEMSN